MARKGKAPTVEKVAEAAAAEAVKEVIPSILKAVAAEVARAVEPAVIAAVQQTIREAVQKAVAGATGGAGGGPVVSFGPPPAPQVHRPESTGVQAGPSGAPPDDPNSPEGRAWLAKKFAASTVRPEPAGERVPVRTGNLAIDRMLNGTRVAMQEKDFQ